MFDINKMVNNGEKTLNNMYKLDVEVIKCQKCKTIYKPTKIDIPTKNPNVYFKNCFTCREQKKTYMREYLKNKKY